MIEHDGIYVVQKNNLIVCWLGEPGDNESELIFEVDKAYVPSIIAALKASEMTNAKTTKRQSPSK
jgi:hypothetical protein